MPSGTSLQTVADDAAHRRWLRLGGDSPSIPPPCNPSYVRSALGRIYVRSRQPTTACTAGAVMRASGRSTRSLRTRSQMTKDRTRNPSSANALLDRPALECRLLENRRAGGVRYSVAGPEPASVDAVGRLSFRNAFSRSCILSIVPCMSSHISRCVCNSPSKASSSV